MGDILSDRTDCAKNATVDNKIYRKNLATKAFLALIITGLYYLSYRYPFQINSSKSSPTYSDTPTWLQAGKYAIIGVILAVTAIVGALDNRQRRFHEVGPFAWARTSFLILSAFALIKGILINSVDLIVLGSSLTVGFVMFGLSAGYKLDAHVLSRAVSQFAVISVAVEVVQLTLFFTQRRLPALAYEGTISVRFGSLLDDPNGYAILIALLLPAVAAGESIRGIWRSTIMMALITCLVLTQSFTGVISVAVALLGGYTALNWRRPIVFASIIMLVPPLILSLYFSVINSDVVQSVWLAKNGSIDGHKQSVDVFWSMSLPDFLGFGAPASFIESSYVSLIASIGLPLTLTYVSLGVWAVIRLHKTVSTAARGSHVAIHRAFFYFLIAYLVGCLNMQFSQVFPLDLFYVLGICLSVFRPTADPSINIRTTDSGNSKPSREISPAEERLGH